MSIDVARHHTDRFANLRFGQGEGGPSRTGDVLTISLPLVADAPQAINVSQGVARCEDVALRQSCWSID